MTISENLELAMKSQKLNDYDLEKLSGVPQPSIQRLRKGTHQNPGIETVKKLAAGLKMSVDALVSENEISEQIPGYVVKGNKYYPKVVGTARCGDHGYYFDLEGGDGYIEFEAEVGSVAIRIKGHSMHPAIREGWYVIIEPNKLPDEGEYVLLKFKDGKKMVKELLRKNQDNYLLLSVNGDERITAQFDELEGIQAVSAIVPPSKHKEW